MTNTSSTPVAFVLRWVLFSTLGLGAGLAVSLGLAGPIEALVGMMLVTPMTLALTGSILGAAQWLAIWKCPHAAWRWIVGSAVALGVGMTLGIVLVETVGRAVTGGQIGLFTTSPIGRMTSLIVIGTLSGVALGAGQWLALRPFRVVTGSWLLRCAVAFGVALPAGGLLADVFLGGLRSTAGFAAFLTVAGLIVGIVTAHAGGRIARDMSIERAVWQPIGPHRLLRSRR